MSATISEKGQVTVPKEIRDDLGLVPGTAITFTQENGAVVIRKSLPRDPIAAWRGRGRLPRGLDADTCLRLVRDGE